MCVYGKLTFPPNKLMFLDGCQKLEEVPPQKPAYTSKKLIGYLYKIAAVFDNYVPNEALTPIS